MRKAIWRTAAATAAVGAVVAAVALLPTGANAAPGDAFSSSFGLSATGLVNVVATPVSTCPPGNSPPLTAVGVDLGPTLGSVGLLTAGSVCSTPGTSSATASAADLKLLGTVLTPLITASAVSSECSQTAPAAPTGSTTVANLVIAGVPITVPLGSTPVTVNIPLVGTVVLNEQITNADGSLTVNAVHITLLGGTQSIIIASVTCGPNVPVAAVAAFSYENLPIVLGGLGIVVLIGFGLRTGTRRLRGLA